MKTMPAALRAALLAAQTDVRVLIFAEITSGTTYHIVNNTQPITVGGNVYSPVAFVIDFPSDKDGEIGEAKLVIDAVDRSIIALIEAATERITVRVFVTSTAAPSATDIDFGTFEWKDVDYDQFTASGTLTYEHLLDVEIPPLEFTPITVPGIF
jgi:hypothetical protein